MLIYGEDIASMTSLIGNWPLSIPTLALVTATGSMILYKQASCLKELSQRIGTPALWRLRRASIILAMYPLSRWFLEQTLPLFQPIQGQYPLGLCAGYESVLSQIRKKKTHFQKARLALMLSLVFEDPISQSDFCGLSIKPPGSLSHVCLATDFTETITLVRMFFALKVSFTESRAHKVVYIPGPIHTLDFGF